MTVNARTITDEEFFYGHKACPGCGGALAVRQALKVLGPHAVAALPAGCMSATGFNFPQLAFGNNAMITPFAATAAVLSGIEAGLRAQGVAPEDVTVVGFAGDGGTADIGLQALSGAIDRNDDVLYICYDNEAYMNTGIQKSSLTPFGASTTTTPAGQARARLPHAEEEPVRHRGGPPHPLRGHGLGGVSERLHQEGGAGARYQGHPFHPRDGALPRGLGLPLGRHGGRGEGNRGYGPVVPRRVRGRRRSRARPAAAFRLNRDPKQFKPIEPYLRRQGRFSADDGADLALIERARDERWSLHARDVGIGRAESKPESLLRNRVAVRLNLPGDSRVAPLFGCVSVPQDSLRFFLEYGEYTWGC